MLALGISFGLLTAWGNTIAYVGSRWFTVGGRGGTLTLIALAHTMLGVAGLVGTLLLWPRGLADSVAAAGAGAGAGGASLWALHGDWLLKALAATVMFAAAQAFLLTALRKTEASRVAPLLGVKIAVLAVLSAWLGGEWLSAGRWAAVVLAVSAGFLLHGAGGQLAWRSTVWVMGAVVSYASCDLLILATIRAVEPVLREADAVWWWPSRGWGLSGDGGGTLVGGKLWASYLTAGVVYLMSGVVAAAMLPWFGSRRWQVWRASGVYAGGWAIAMVTLYPCFAMVGVVLGAILQSSRALWSIVLGWWLSNNGHAHLEPAHGAAVWVRRGLAAALMVVAVVLYATDWHWHGR